jgi:hypothetical protein
MRTRNDAYLIPIAFTNGRSYDVAMPGIARIPSRQVDMASNPNSASGAVDSRGEFEVVWLTGRAGCRPSDGT